MSRYLTPRQTQEVTGALDTMPGWSKVQIQLLPSPVYQVIGMSRMLRHNTATKCLHFRWVELLDWRWQLPVVGVGPRWKFLSFNSTCVPCVAQDSFIGYSSDKLQWIMHLHRRGYKLSQLGGAFVIHYPHKLDTWVVVSWIFFQNVYLIIAFCLQQMEGQENSYEWRAPRALWYYLRKLQVFLEGVARRGKCSVLLGFPPMNRSNVHNENIYRRVHVNHVNWSSPIGFENLWSHDNRTHLHLPTPTYAWAAFVAPIRFSFDWLTVLLWKWWMILPRHWQENLGNVVKINTAMCKHCHCSNYGPCSLQTLNDHKW